MQTIIRIDKKTRLLANGNEKNIEIMNLTIAKNEKAKIKNIFRASSNFEPAT